MLVHLAIPFLFLYPLSVVAPYSQLTNAKERYDVAFINHSYQFSELCKSFDRQTRAERQLVAAKQRAECNWWVAQEIFEQAKRDHKERTTAYRRIKQEKDDAQKAYDKAKEEFDQQQKLKLIDNGREEKQQNEKRQLNQITVRNWFRKK